MTFRFSWFRKAVSTIPLKRKGRELLERQREGVFIQLF